jgi:hypothetical protein
MEIEEVFEARMASSLSCSLMRVGPERLDEAWESYNGA